MNDTVTSTISAQSCEHNNTIHSCRIVIPPAVCSPSANINVTILADNRIGQGPPSDVITIGMNSCSRWGMIVWCSFLVTGKTVSFVFFSVHAGCTNSFIQLKFNSSTSTLYCIFLNDLENSRKKCSIIYGVCGQKLTETIEDYSNSNNEDPNRISFSLTHLPAGKYCYSATASSDITTVIVKGEIEKCK